MIRFPDPWDRKGNPAPPDHKASKDRPDPWDRPDPLAVAPEGEPLDHKDPPDLQGLQVLPELPEKPDPWDRREKPAPPDLQGLQGVAGRYRPVSYKQQSSNIFKPIQSKPGAVAVRSSQRLRVSR